MLGLTADPKVPAQEARAGLAEFQIPKDFGRKLLPFQKAAVQIAAPRRTLISKRK